jgi:hypothetical protein
LHAVDFALDLFQQRAGGWNAWAMVVTNSVFIRSLSRKDSSARLRSEMSSMKAVKV